MTVREKIARMTDAELTALVIRLEERGNSSTDQRKLEIALSEIARRKNAN